jgi:hypothetical protein
MHKYHIGKKKELFTTRLSPNLQLVPTGQGIFLHLLNMSSNYLVHAIQLMDSKLRQIIPSHIFRS